MKTAMKNPTRSSIWRRELAKELVNIYMKKPGLEMALLGGSPARGLADEFSDMDIVLYWKKLDAKWIKSHPLEKLGCKMITLLDMPKEQSALEIYTLNGLIVEIGHSTVASLQKEVKEVTEEYKANPSIINSIGGFLDAFPLAGESQYRSFKAAIPKYPRPLAKKVIEQNLGFFWNGCLENQGVKRGEILFVYDAISFTLKKLINILSALNGLYFWAGEARWLEYRSRKMKYCPPRLWPRIKKIFQEPPNKALTDMNRVKNEVLALVSKHMPEVDMDKIKRFEKLRVGATTKRPAINVS
jgi:hypothetical protein